MGEDCAFFRWVLFKVASGAWPFYDGCAICYWNCWKDWQLMNGEPMDVEELKRALQPFMDECVVYATFKDGCFYYPLLGTTYMHDEEGHLVLVLGRIPAQGPAESEEAKHGDNG